MTKRIVAEDLSRRYGDELALDRFSVEVSAGEIHAIVGLNGAGKTTLMRVLMAMIRPSTGRVLLNGADVSGASPTIWAEVGHMIEATSGYPELTVVENIGAAARLRGIPTRDVESATGAVIDRFELGRWAGHRAR
jgi:ABC-2 type transport system ATP-binding protein